MMLLEFIQLAYYPLSKCDSSISTAPAPVINAICYLTLKCILTEQSFAFLFYVALGVSTFFIISYLSLLVLGYCSTESKGKWTDSCQLWFKLYSFLLILLQYLFVVPIATILLIAYETGYNLQGNPLVAVNIIIAAVGTLILALVLLAIVSTIYLFHEEQINSSIPWTMIPMLLDYMKLFKKVCVALALSLDQTTLSDEVFLIIFFVITSAEIWIFLVSPSPEKKWINYTVIFCEAACWSISIFSMAHSFVSDNLLDYFTLILFLLPTSITIIALFKRRKQQEIIESHAVQRFHSSTEIDEYIRQFNVMISESSSLQAYAKLIAIVKQHCANCQDLECPCTTFCVKEDEENEDYSENSLSEHPVKFQEVNYGESFQKSASHVKFITAVYKLMDYMIFNYMQKSGKYANLFILSAYIQYFHLKNKFQALYNLQQANDLDPDSYQQYQIYKLRYTFRSSF